MSAPPEFRLIPLADLLEHEEIEQESAEALAEVIRGAGRLVHPIWVARGSLVILNGHHRVAALRLLGAARAPAWVVDYDSDLVALDRWSPGPPISKQEVVRRAREHRLFPPKTTRHDLRFDLPERVTTLADLMAAGPAVPDTAQRRASGRSRSPGSGATGST